MEPTHSSILAWRIPWTEEPGRLQSTGSQRVGHDWSDLACTQALRHVGSSLFIAAYRIFRYSMWTLSCSIWDLVPWPGIEPRSPTLGVWHFNHWPTGKSIFTILLFLFWGLAAAAPPSRGFPRQEHWSGLPFPSPMHESEKSKWTCSVVSDP